MTVHSKPEKRGMRPIYAEKTARSIARCGKEQDSLTGRRGICTFLESTPSGLFDPNGVNAGLHGFKTPRVSLAHFQGFFKATQLNGHFTQLIAMRLGDRIGANDCAAMNLPEQFRV